MLLKYRCYNQWITQGSLVFYFKRRCRITYIRLQITFLPESKLYGCKLYGKFKF